MAVGVVYIYLEGVRIQEMESLFEVAQSDVAIFERKRYEVILMANFNVREDWAEGSTP